MIEEQARVVSVEPGGVWVETQRQTACGQCAVNKGCGTSVLARVLGNRRVRVRAITNLELEPGETVVIGVQEGAFVRGSLAIYLFPLLTLFLGGVLGEVIAAGLSAAAEWPTLLGGGLGLGLGFLWVRRFSRRIVADRRYQPVVLKRLQHASVPGLTSAGS